MKQTNLIFAMLIISINMIAQDFAPVGAEWYYTEGFQWVKDKNYLKIASVKDTFYQGKNCRKLVKYLYLECAFRPQIEYVYSEDSVVYYWDQNLSNFQILYDLKKRKDDFWTLKIKDSSYGDIDSVVVKVDSINSIIINENTLKTLYLTFTIYSDLPEINYHTRIVERIGDFKYLFDIYPASYFYCDFNFSEGLRCYSDTVLGYYSTGIADSCTYTYKSTSINENNPKTGFTVFPNPANDIFQVNINSANLTNIRIYDLLGNNIYSKDFTSNIKIDLRDLSNGIYIVTIRERNKFIGTKKILKK